MSDYEQTLGSIKPNSPYYEQEHIPEMHTCSDCGDRLPESEMIEDKYKGKPTGCWFCKDCNDYHLNEI